MQLRQHASQDNAVENAMAKLSIRDAAQLVGKHDTTILRAIDAGKLSAGKNVHGQWEIDPAELQRVYEIVADPGGESQANGALRDAASAGARSAHAPDGEPVKLQLLERELANKSERIEALEHERDRERRLLQERIEDLQKDRDNWREQASQNTRLLEHQQSQEDRLREELKRKDEAAEAAREAAKPKGLLARMFGS
jgi:hypothetical protein